MLQHKKTLLRSLAFLILCVCIYAEGWHALWGMSVLAAEAANMFESTAQLAVIITTAMETFAFLIFHFLVGLLDPLFVMGISETEALRNIWKYSRDIVNIIFAFMLIAAGIYTVVTGNKEIVQQKYKSFIIAVILVNFSWFFPRVIFDVANVITATIYQLPAGLSGDAVDCTLPPAKDGEAGKPCQVITDVKYFKGCNPPPPGYIDKLGIVCYKTEDWKKDTNTAFGMLNGLVMNYAKLPDLTRVLNPDAGGGADGTPEQQLKDYLLFLIHVIFVLVLMAMLFLPLAAMFVVFLIRIPIIWLTISFMPFMFLGFVIGDKMGQFDTMKIFQHFVKAAFLPAAVAVPFAAGFLVLSQVTQIKCEDTVAAGFKWCTDTGPILLNVHTLWGLMMLFISFFVIWSGFWAALKIDDIYVNLTNGIKSFGDSVGKTALKLPFSIPILPVGDGGNMSILGIDDKLRNFSSGLSAGKGPGEALGLGDNNELGKALSKSDGKTNRELTKILNELKKNKPGQFNDGGLRKEIGDMLNAPGDNALKIALKADGLDPKKVSTEDIMNKIGSADGPLADLVKDMRKPPKKEEGGGA